MVDGEAVSIIWVSDIDFEEIGILFGWVFEAIVFETAFW